jgi:hypothetical protein
MDLQKAMENMNPAGLVGQIQELTKLTKEINNITTTIAQNLPGAPYSFITLAAQLVKQLGTVGNGLTGILGQLDPSVEHILESNIKLPDMSAMTDQINKVMSALTPEQFLNNLPGSLSPDGLIASIAKSDPTLMAGLQSVTGQLQNAQGAYDQASSAVTGMVSPQNAIDIPLPPSRPIDLGTTVPLPPSRPANLGTITDTGTPTSSGIVAASVPASSGIVAASVNPTIATVATYDAPINDQIQLEAVDTPVISTFVDEPVSVEPIPIPLEDLGRINVTIDLDSDITDDVWNSLLEYTQAITSPNSQEKAWFIKTIINRSKKTGLGILETLSQFSENLVINAVSPEDKEAIGNSIIEWFSGIPKNNYFFDPIKDGALDTQPPKRKGVTGIRIGDCFVYPGARWP